MVHPPDINDKRKAELLARAEAEQARREAAVRAPADPAPAAVVDIATAPRRRPREEGPRPVDGDAQRDTQRGRADPTETRAAQLVALVERMGAEYAHDRLGDGYVRVDVERAGVTTRQTVRVESGAMRRIIAREYYRAHGGAPSSEAMAAALGILAARAAYDGDEVDVMLRVGGDPSTVWLDLGDPAWRAVRVDAQGWRIVEEPDAWMRRPPGMRPLPEPVRGGSLDELRGLIPALAADDDAWALVVAWLLCAVYPRGPYPVLALAGEQGSGKTTVARWLRGIVDPAAPDLRAPPREDRDLAAAASSSWIVGADNVSRVPEWLADALCRFSTGGGIAARKLYTDAEEMLLEATRPVLLTSIPDVVAHRADLAERSLRVTLPPLPARATEAELLERYEAMRPRLLGALLDRLAGAMRVLSSVQERDLPRMADAARLARAAEISADEPPRVLSAWRAMARAGDVDAVDASPIGPALLALAAEGPWDGSAAALLERLSAIAGEAATRAKGEWPRTARGLAGELRRIAPALRRVGIAVELPEGARTARERTIRVRGPVA